MSIELLLVLPKIVGVRGKSFRCNLFVTKIQSMCFEKICYKTSFLNNLTGSDGIRISCCHEITEEVIPTHLPSHEDKVSYLQLVVVELIRVEGFGKLVE